jgi:aryl-alcohol dehydrogenase-like predicted oxidoreductase
LTRPWEHTSTSRENSDKFGKKLAQRTADIDRGVIEKVSEIAAARKLPMAQIALAWQFTKPYIIAPIIGATKPEHLQDAIAATALQLSAEEITKLEEPYIPHPVIGHE